MTEIPPRPDTLPEVAETNPGQFTSEKTLPSLTNFVPQHSEGLRQEYLANKQREQETGVGLFNPDNIQDWRSDISRRRMQARRQQKHVPKAIEEFDIGQAEVWFSYHRIDNSIRAEDNILTARDPKVDIVLGFINSRWWVPASVQKDLRIAAARYLNYTKISLNSEISGDFIFTLVEKLLIILDDKIADLPKADASRLVGDAAELTVRQYFDNFGRTGDAHEQFLEVMTALLIRRKREQSSKPTRTIERTYGEEPAADIHYETTAFSPSELYRKTLRLCYLDEMHFYHEYLAINALKEEDFSRKTFRRTILGKAADLSHEVLYELPRAYDNRRIIYRGGIPTPVHRKDMPTLPNNLQSFEQLLPSFQILIAALSLLCVLYNYRIPNEVVVRVYRHLVPRLSYLQPEYLGMRQTIETIFNGFYNLQPDASPIQDVQTCPNSFPLSSPTEKFI